MDIKKLFADLYASQTENQLEFIINHNSILNDPKNWFPIGKNESNYGIIENPPVQASRLNLNKCKRPAYNHLCRDAQFLVQ